MELEEALCAAVRVHLPPATGIGRLRRLSGGASQETWSFDATGPQGDEPLILRRRAGGAVQAHAIESAITLETEAELLGLAAKADVPVPTVRFVLQPDDQLGSGYVMGRLEGETLAPKILRDEAFARVRPQLARQCGEVLARIHSVPRNELPKLPEAPAAVLLDQYRAVYDRFDHPRPVFELAFRWIEDNLPTQNALGLVHGDFRNGNLVIAPDGLRGVLDWEIAHIGDPMEDLGWICVNSWRFGRIDQPVGGFGSREELAAGYEAASGHAVDLGRVRFWEVVGTLKWGVICTMMLWSFRGGNRSVERAAIGRRASETEIDLLALIAPTAAPEPTG